MKPALFILLVALFGTWLGYEGGKTYCRDQLNTGQIYEENPHIPPEIADGSAYGAIGAKWGFGVATTVGGAIVAISLLRNRR